MLDDDSKETMAAGKRPAYAVCPRIERNGNIVSPKLFKSESSAKRFLNSEVRFPLEPEAEVTGLTVEEVRARRADCKDRLNRERKEAANRIKLGELHPLACPPQLQRILNRHQGWQDPVPVRRAAEYSGPACNRPVRQFLPIDAVGVMPAFNLTEEIGRALEGRSADYRSYLDQDWRFAEIEADAERRTGHEYGGRQHRNIAEIVVKAIHDIEDAFLRLHPNASCQAVADFWCSWQLQRHVAQFCGRVADSEVARLLAGSTFEAAEEAERTRLYVYRQLAAFAHEVTTDGPLPVQGRSTGLLPAAPQSGFIAEDQKFARLAIEEAKKSVSEDDGRAHPKVGVVVVKDGQVLALAHRGEIPKCHAEFIALDCKLADVSIVGATIYTTLEPCTKRNHPKLPCAERLVDRKVSRVVIGMFDPNPDITTHGQQVLRRANIITDVFPHNLMSEVEELNRNFDRMHRTPAGGGPQRVIIESRLTAALPSSRPKVIPVRYGRLPEGELGEGLYLDNDGDPAYGVHVEPLAIGSWTLTFSGIDRLKGESWSAGSISQGNTSITTLDSPWRESWDAMGRPDGVPLHIIYRDFENRCYRSLCSLDRDVLNRDSGFSVRFIGQEMIQEASL